MDTSPKRSRLTVAYVASLALLGVTACAALDETAIASLRAQGLHVFAGNGYVVRSDEGWQAEFPALPSAEREEYGLGSRLVRATSVSLYTEGNSRGYVLRVYDARAMTSEAREELRALAERNVSRLGEAGPSHIAHEGGVAMHELTIPELEDNPFHAALVRTFVLDGFVVEAIVYAQHGLGASSDARAFFASFRVRH